ncbi:MAG TPA: aminotransferase class V-fold PLP-dependent enzyme, partial [Myxococcota bacterium]|nr:aminotransferase class V-fold PLP-dependent enzyme [Myxococcota bacterium]
MTDTDPRPIREPFLLDPEWDFLNHGSFGACPRAVLDVQADLRRRMERQPVRFLDNEHEALLDGARRALAAFVGADPEGLAFVPNATTGVNAVLRSLPLGPGDALLVTDHAYGACRNALDDAAARAGARVVVARIPFPLADPVQVVDAVLG